MACSLPNQGSKHSFSEVMTRNAHRSIRLRSGNQMIAEGAIAAGCKFFAGYPITPATGIFKTMVDELPLHGGVALSAPDEISAIAYCIGASMRGFKAMTATSGPGWALMTESVQYALMTETPLVVALVQRLGPSTGGATQGAQGDVLLAEFCTSGGYTLPVLCPTNVYECYELTMLAFNWSEKLRTPVIVLSDKETSMTVESVDSSLLSPMPLQEREPVYDTHETAWETETGTYSFERLEDVPRFAPVGGRVKVTATGSAHDKRGRLQKNSLDTIEVLRHLEQKIRHRADELAVVTTDLDAHAKTLVISYGITSRAARQAVRQARRQGHHISFMNILSLFPVPVERIARVLNGVERVLVAEENLYGLYRQVIAPHCGGRPVIGINGIGSMITPHQILEAIGAG